MRPPHDKPLSAVAEGGEIILDGPDGLAVSLTPAAAEESAAAITKALDPTPPIDPTPDIPES